MRKAALALVAGVALIAIAVLAIAIRSGGKGCGPDTLQSPYCRPSANVPVITDPAVLFSPTVTQLATPTATPSASATAPGSGTPFNCLYDPRGCHTAGQPPSPPGPQPTPTPRPTPPPPPPPPPGTVAWLQTMDSCSEALGSAQYELTGNGLEEVVTTPSAPLPRTVVTRTPNCPLQRGNCATFSQGCVSFTGLRPGQYTIRQTRPATSNGVSYATCTGGSACRLETVSLSVHADGSMSATTTNVFPDTTRAVWPTGSSYAGTRADPIVTHDFALGTGSCDGDGDADDHLSGAASSHCPYLPEGDESTACQPYPWSCTMGAQPQAQQASYRRGFAEYQA